MNTKQIAIEILAALVFAYALLFAVLMSLDYEPWPELKLVRGDPIWDVARK